ncbi:T9SS type A sorting domain-containing protein [Adhaeribacter terreus]|uniref:T9SS type A sorting domain-containing protein n=1 Tax=Adhaeribacter terreus TaxID=529703 RepID=A0ABW0EAF1_9BACT
MTHLLPIFTSRKWKAFNFSLLRVLWLFIVLSKVSNVFGQKETANWFFGSGAGLDFNGSAPVATTNGSLHTLEGCSSISDSTGKLLFYTDGVKVWNRMHQVMANGTDLWGNWSTTQSALIVKQPSLDLYYIFTVDFQAGAFGNYGGLAYSIVDMRLEDGLGAVTTKNTPLLTPTAEKISAVHHRNGTDVWIMTQQWGSNAKYAWLLTGNGLNPTPAISRLGIVHNNPVNGNGQAQGHLKFSHNGQKAASTITHNGLIELYDFDNSTGVLSNLKTLNMDDGYYALEFSPNDSILYTTSNTKLYQFHIALPTEKQIYDSRFLLYEIPVTPTAFLFGGMQLALDSKIYLGKRNAESLGVITYPDSLGLSCNYQHTAIFLNGRRNSSGLPNFVQSLFSDRLKTPDPISNPGPADTTTTVSQNPGIYITPLPYTPNYKIVVQDPELKYVEVYLYNDIGQVIFTRKENNLSKKFTTELDLSRYARSIYFVVVLTNKGKAIRKIVKF